MVVAVDGRRYRCIRMHASSLIKLGHRLREVPSDDDVLRYDAFRAGFQPALEEIERRCRGLVPLASSLTARLKTLESTQAKLRRQASRLHRIQDIAGLRVVVANTVIQDEALVALAAAFPSCHIDDYRVSTQHGYRAVHVIVRSTSGHSVEIQLRTVPQNVWANLSELLAQGLAPELKYGSGPPKALEALASLSQVTTDFDEALAEVERRARHAQGLLAMLDTARSDEADDPAVAAGIEAEALEHIEPMQPLFNTTRQLADTLLEQAQALGRMIEGSTLP